MVAMGHRAPRAYGRCGEAWEAWGSCQRQRLEGGAALAAVSGCSSCRSYAWSNEMQPVAVGKTLHHPSCRACEGAASVGVVVATSGDVDACAAGVAAKIEQMDQVIADFYSRKYAPALIASTQIIPTGDVPLEKQDEFNDDNAFFADWRAFRLDFRNWKVEWEDSVSGGIATGPWYDECSGYADRTNDWISKFNERAIGAKIQKLPNVSEIKPGVVFDKTATESSQEPSSLLSSLGTIVKWGVGVLVIGGALVLILSLRSAVK
jgi:hypothetical protein